MTKQEQNELNRIEKDLKSPTSTLKLKSTLPFERIKFDSKNNVTTVDDYINKYFHMTYDQYYAIADEDIYSCDKNERYKNRQLRNEAINELAAEVFHFIEDYLDVHKATPDDEIIEKINNVSFHLIIPDSGQYYKLIEKKIIIKEIEEIFENAIKHNTIVDGLVVNPKIHVEFNYNLYKPTEGERR